MNALAAYWRSRSVPERRVLASLGALGAAILFVALAWLPLERARARLSAETPRLEGAIATLQRQAEEVKRVRALPALTPSSAAPLASLVSSGALTRTFPGAQAALVDDRRVRVSASDAAYGTLLEAIAAAQSVHGLRVESARIEALPAGGRVRAELTLARS